MKHFLQTLSFVVFLAGAAFAQTTATLTGNTTDKSGAVVPGAKVTLVNSETQLTREVYSDESGAYNVPLLPPGVYTLSVQKQGFKALRQENIPLGVNAAVRLDFQLEIGAVSETIDVRDAPPLLESDTSAIGQVIENRQIIELPLNGRNFVQLATLGPGVTGVGFGAAGTIMSGNRPDDSRPGSELFANGNREGANNFLLDGVDNNDRLTLSITLRPSVEGVREFKIQTSLFSAENGRSPGATVNVVSKSGTNELHGSAYNFLRNSAVDAREFFARPGQAKPAFRQNQFGASLGGRIIRNKLFYFGNYEGYRRRRQEVSVNTVPLPAVRTGDFSAVRDIFDPFTTRPMAGTASGFVRDPFPNRMIPANRFDSITSRMIQAYPAPQTPGLANNHTSVLGRSVNWDQGDGRIDYNLSDRDFIFGRYSRQDTLDTRPSTFPNSNIPGFPANPVGLGSEATFAGESFLKAYHSAIAWTRSWTPTFLMDARMGFSRFNLDFKQEGAVDGAMLGERLGVRNANQGPRADGIPIFSPAAYQGIGQTRSLPILRIQNVFNPNVNFTKIAGKHTFKGGVDIRRRQLTEFQTNRGNGRFNFNQTFTTNPNSTGNTGDSMASFLLGTAATIEQDFTLAYVGMRGWESGYFFQDDWKVSSRLTLNLGLRWEYFTPYKEVANRFANFDISTGRMRIAGLNTDEYAGVRPNKDNWAPRAGLAYKLRDTTVLRAGAGVYYAVQGNGGAALRLFRQLPFGPINTIDINNFSASPRRVQDGLPPIPALDFQTVTTADNVGTFISIPADFKSGRIMQFSLQLQQELPRAGIVLKGGYVGNLGRRLDNTYDFNQPIPGPGAAGPRRPLFGLASNAQGVTYNPTDGRSNYHAFQSTAEKRFSQGLSFLAAYTYAKSIDNVANQFGGGSNGPLPQDRRFRNIDRGPSGFDIRHRFTNSMNYELPFGRGKRFSSSHGFVNHALGGWQTNLIFTVQSGLPYTPTLANSVSNAGGSRPDRFKQGDIHIKTPQQYFDTSFNRPDAAWGIPTTFTFGNSGRNILNGPGRINWDFSTFKDFAFTERLRLQFRAEFFNLFNTPQFALPDATIGNPSAGTITALSGNNRQVQFALRFVF